MIEKCPSQLYEGSSVNVLFFLNRNGNNILKKEEQLQLSFLASRQCIAHPRTDLNLSDNYKKLKYFCLLG